MGAKLTPEKEEILNKKKSSKKIQKKYDERKKNATVSSLLKEQFQQANFLRALLQDQANVATQQVAM